MCWNAASKDAGLKFCHPITFLFWLFSLEKVWTQFYPSYHCCFSTGSASSLNKPPCHWANIPNIFTIISCKRLVCWYFNPCQQMVYAQPWIRPRIRHSISARRKLAQRQYKTRHNFVGKVIQRELLKKFKLTMPTNGICTTKIFSRKRDAQNSFRFSDTNWAFNLGKTIRHRDSQKKKKKKRTCRRVNFAIPDDQDKTDEKRKDR